MCVRGRHVRNQRTELRFSPGPSSVSVNNEGKLPLVSMIGGRLESVHFLLVPVFLFPALLALFHRRGQLSLPYNVRASLLFPIFSSAGRICLLMYLCLICCIVHAQNSASFPSSSFAVTMNRSTIRSASLTNLQCIRSLQIRRTLSLLLSC